MKAPARLLTSRDRLLLSAIDRVPLTVVQLLKLSATFPQPFTDARLLRRRLAELCKAGWMKSFRYALADSRGSPPAYYRLTLRGYRMLHGPDSVPPTKRAFDAIAVIRHEHTKALADFLVHLQVLCHCEGFEISGFHRENTLVIESTAGTARPDAAFSIVSPRGRQYRYVLELDNGSEVISSQRDRETIARKLRVYDQHQAGFSAIDSERPVLLLVSTRGGSRLGHMLDAARGVLEDTSRTVVLATDIRAFLATDQLSNPVLTDHRAKPRTLIPTSATSRQKSHRRMASPIEV